LFGARCSESSRLSIAVEAAAFGMQ